jgi:hypothetical protein
MIGWLPLLAAGTVLSALAVSPAHAAATVLLADSWATGERHIQQLPTRSAWYASSAERLTATAGELTGVLDGSSRLWITYFTNGEPITLAEGETLRVTLRWVADGVNVGNANRGLRVGLFNYGAGGSRVFEDGISSSGGNGASVRGYLLNTNFGPTWGLDNPLELRRRTALADANLMGSINAFTALTTGGGALGGAAFVSGREYTLTLSVERLATGARLRVQFADGLGWQTAVEVDDPDGEFAFDALAIRPEADVRTATRFRIQQLTVEYVGEGQGGGDPPPTGSLWADLPADAAGNRLTEIGSLWDGAWPWVYHHEAADWMYIAPGSARDGAIRGYSTIYGGYWWTTTAVAGGGGWHYIHDLEAWTPWNAVSEDALYDRGKPVPTPHDAIPAGNRMIYVATTGVSGTAGTEEQPLATLAQAVNIVQPGDVIVMRGGVYRQTSTITIGTNRNGTATQPITVINYPGETPILDFEGQALGSIGLRLNASHWRVIGLTVRNAGHNGIRMDGSYNRLERVVAHNNHDTGIHMAGSASYNLVFNCDSYRNFNTTGRVGNNADGFGVKFDNIGPGNYLYGCRSWENSDDGYDFWRSPSRITVENCWAFGNGDASVFGFPAGFDGGGNGFKLGGDFVAGDHVVMRSLAFNNFGYRDGRVQSAKGFDHNNNSGALTLIHNTAWNNGRNFIFPNAPAAAGATHVLYNNLSAPSTVQVQLASNTVQQGNSWQTGQFATAALFRSVDVALAKSPRQADGSLPRIDLLRPVAGTFIVDGGAVLGTGWRYNGSAPDIGAYELSAE